MSCVRLGPESNSPRVVGPTFNLPQLHHSTLAVGDKLHFSDLKLPEGVQLVEDVSLPVLKIMRK